MDSASLFAKPHFLVNCRPHLSFFFFFCQKKREEKCFKWNWEVMFPHCVTFLCLPLLQFGCSADHERSADVDRKSFH